MSHNSKKDPLQNLFAINYTPNKMQGSKFSNKLIIAFLTILITVSLTINMLMFTKLTISFKKLQFQRIFPIGYDAEWEKNSYLTDTKNQEEKNGIVLLGDSRAQMWDTSTLNEYQFYNRAHGGQTSSQVLFQIKEYPLPKAKWVILQVGINDLHPIGTIPEKKQRIIQQCKDNINEITKILLLNKYKIILTTLFPISDIPWDRLHLWDDKTAEIIMDVNHHLKQIGCMENVILLDAYEMLVSPGGKLNREYVDSDFFLHLNHKGYHLLNKKIKDFVAGEEK